MNKLLPLIVALIVLGAFSALAQISVSDILFNEVDRAANVTATFTIQNTANITATNVQLDLSNIPREYNASVQGVIPTQLAPAEQRTLTLQLTIPSRQDSGQARIGDLRITSSLGTVIKPVLVNAKSYLVIKSIKINGKTSGDLSIEEANEVEVDVENRFNQDMENVVVNVKILDVDGDDLEEESDDFDLNNDDNKKEKVEFDLRGEELDEDSYVIEVTVEGDDEEFGSTHTATQRVTADLNLENHNLVITRTSLDQSVLDCERQTGLHVTVENIGKNDEDEVVVRVRNAALGIDLSQDELELDKFSRSDSKDDLRFNFNVEKAKVGSYPLTIEVFRDTTRLEDQTEVVLEVRACSIGQTTQGTGTTTYPSAEQTAQQARDLAAQLQQQLAQRQTAQQVVPSSQPAVLSSFRESSTYTLLLGVLAILVFIAMVLAILVLASGRRRAPQREESKKKGK